MVPNGSSTVQSGARILVVEDEESIGQGLCDVLSFRGHQVTWHTDGRQACNCGITNPFDLVLLDIMLPSCDGWSVCQQLRESGVQAGIILLTAKGAEDDILRGFQLGADDYVTKPFSLRQLLARVDAVLGRSRLTSNDDFGIGELTVDVSSRALRGNQGEVELTAREIAVLRLLLNDPGRIVSRRALLREVWEMPNPDAVETRTVDVHIAKLRKKLAQVTHARIQAVRGQGYRYEEKQ